MAGLDHQAQALKALLAGRGFVRRDRSGKALFASDAPRRSPETWGRLKEELLRSGYLLSQTDGLAFISWDYPKSLAFCQALHVPEGWAGGEGSLAGFCRILARHKGEFSRDMLPRFFQCLLIWDRGEGQALRRAAETALAGALREHRPLPAYFLPLLLTLPERRTPC